MKKLEELKKGCGKKFSFFGGSLIIKCGDRDKKNEVFLCNSCEELVNQQEEIIIKIKKVLERINKKIELNEKMRTYESRHYRDGNKDGFSEAKLIIKQEFRGSLNLCAEKIIKQEFGELE